MHESNNMALNPEPLSLFEGGGKMGALMEAYDWNSHSMGSPDRWPASLQNIIRLMLKAHYPMFIWWSHELYMFHNDHYIPALGKKHPEALGASAREMWAEIWEQVGGIAENILQGGDSFYAEEMQFFLERKGFLEETYWTFSYSPAPDDRGLPGGMFCTCNEVTHTVLSRRRMETVRYIADATLEISSLEQVCHKIGLALARNLSDIPFSLIYLLNPEETAASLMAKTGNCHSASAPEIIDLGVPADIQVWPLQQLASSKKSITLDHAQEGGKSWPSGMGGEACRTSVVFPILKPGEDELLGFFIAGVNPRLEYDTDYYHFHDLLTGQIATSVAAVQAREEAERRQEDLIKLFEQAPVAIAILRGPELVVELANQPICEIWGRRHEEVINRPVFEVLVEASGQGLEEILQEVMETGEPYVASELAVPLNRNGKLKQVYLNFVYYPLRNAKSVITGVTAVAVEVTEQVEWRQQIEAKNKELLTINADLDNFVYSASHDLKAPISNIEGLMHALVRYLPEETLASERVNKLIGLIQASVDRFKKTVTDLTEVSKIQREEGELATEVDLAEVVEEVQMDLQSLISEAEATIETDFVQCRSLRFSPRNMRSIVYNLLSNALKYRSPHRPLHIRMRTQSSGDYWILSVTDNGLGISQADRSKIFSMFKRLHDHVEGSGIGLYILKKIVENAGGKIEVESEPDKGSTFSVYLKKA